MHAILFTLAALSAPAPVVAQAKKPFTVHDLVRLERVSDPHVAPDGTTVIYDLRETDFDANKSVHSVWLYDFGTKTSRRLTAAGSSNEAARYSADGKSVYFLSDRSGSSQVWRLDLNGGEAQPVTTLPIDVSAFAVVPDGKTLAIAMDVFTDCITVACTKQRLDDKAKNKSTGQLYDQLFVRHWDTWRDGRRSQIFAVPVVQSGQEPVKLTKDIDGDAPTKPFGDSNEWSFTPDGKFMFFTARIAGRTEPWSTNLDVFRVPVDGSAKPVNLTSSNLATDVGPLVSPDGKLLAYRAMKRPGFEADRLAVMVVPTAGGTAREIAPLWDRSADGLGWSPDSKTLYALAEDVGQKRVFALDPSAGAPKPVTDKGNVESFDTIAGGVIVAMDDLRSPAQLYRIPVGSPREQLTKHNSERMEKIALGDFEQFNFVGWNGEMVYGYIVKPANFVPGRTYPVAFLIHGGPQGSFGNHWHYRWNPQTYAGAGFVAVMVDFHGSTGYGQTFTDSISRDWGGKPLEDLQKGWQHVTNTYKFVDGSRACALGASYGGYMINWIAGKWQEPWKCLVNHDGVFDSRGMAYATDELWFDEWEAGGKQYEHPENYEQWNPINLVAKWKVPMLVVHSGNDFRVTLDQGLSAFTALQSRDIPSQLLYFPNENHWVVKPQNSVQWHETVEAWLKRWTAKK